MSRATIERLGLLPLRDRTEAHWADTDVDLVAGQVRDHLDLGGTLLPPCRAYRRFTRPVVRWDLNGLAARMSSGVGPILDRARVRDLLDGPGGGTVPVALTPAAFLSLGSFRMAKTDLAVLSIYARAVWIVPGPSGSPMWDSLECEVKGYTVVEARPDHPEVLVHGYPGPDPICRPVDIQVRLLQEQLFDVAIRTGMVPPI
jgi:hypothetical protein